MPRGASAGADSGDPQISWTAFETPGDVEVGVWQVEPGGWSIVNRSDAKTCYIISETSRKVYSMVVSAG